MAKYVAEPQGTEERTILWVRRYEDALSRDEKYHKKINADLRFALDLVHWINDDTQEDNANRLKPRGRQLIRKIIRMTADAMHSTRFVDALPQDDEGDADTASIAKAAVLTELETPEKGFDVFLERAILGALAAREWYVGIEWDSDEGPFGEILFDNTDPTQLFMCPPFRDIWHRKLPWVIEAKLMPLSSLKGKKGWKNTENLVADMTFAQMRADGRASIDEHGNVIYSSSASGEEMETDGAVLVLKCMTRVDSTVRKTIKRDARQLEPKDQYLACPDCHYRTPTAGEMDLPNGFAGDVGDPCPECRAKGMLHFTERVHTLAEETTTLAFPKGRIEYIAYNQRLSLFDDSWENWMAPMRSYPYIQIKAHEHPRDRSGPSETFMDRSHQIITNVIEYRMYQQVLTSPNVLAVRGAPPRDAVGNLWQPTDAPWSMMYWDDLATGQIDHFHPDPISAGLVKAFDIFNNDLRSDIGTAELATQPDQTQDIPVGTAREIVQSGAVPTQAFIKRMQTPLAVGYGVISDIQKHRWSMARWIRHQNEDGVTMAKKLKGADIPNADFIFTADPSTRLVKVEEMKAIAAWAQFPPALRRVAANKIGLSIRDVERIEADEKKAADEARQQMLNGMAGGVPAMGGANGVVGAAPAPQPQVFGAQ